MNFLFFFIILPNVLNEEDSIKNFNLYEFYIQYNSSNYIMDLYHNDLTEFLIKNFPLNNKLLLKDDKLLSIQLDSTFKITQTIEKKQFKKGNIISDGKTISLYYNNSQSYLSKNTYILIGNFKEIDKLIEISDNGNISIYINLITLCKSTVVSYYNSIILSNKSTSFLLFSRNANHFYDVPYLYVNNNNDDLSKYCKIEKNSISIKCTFDDEFFTKYSGTILNIVEVIPGCEFPINSGIAIVLPPEYCESIEEDGECTKCHSGYYYKKKENKCKKKNKSLFYFLVIGLPIIWFFSIIISICIILDKDKNNGLFFVLAFFFGPITLIGLIIYFYK